MKNLKNNVQVIAVGLVVVGLGVGVSTVIAKGIGIASTAALAPSDIPQPKRTPPRLAEGGGADQGGATQCKWSASTGAGGPGG